MQTSVCWIAEYNEPCWQIVEERHELSRPACSRLVVGCTRETRDDMSNASELVSHILYINGIT